jgi:hypothetical protein
MERTMKFPRIHNRRTPIDVFVDAVIGLGLFSFGYCMLIALLGWPA